MFTSYADTLPDPVFKTDEAGASSSTGNAGPGFAKVKFTSSNQTQVQRTISGRGVTASPSYHQWSFNISYNPLTRDEFEPVTSFLESRNGRRNPFYVVLPQYNKPRDSAFYPPINQLSDPYGHNLNAYWGKEGVDANGWYAEPISNGNNASYLGVPHCFSLQAQATPGRKHLWSNILPATAFNGKVARLQAIGLNPAQDDISILVRFFTSADRTQFTDVTLTFPRNSGGVILERSNYAAVPANTLEFQMVIYNEGSFVTTSNPAISYVRLTILEDFASLADLGVITASATTAGSQTLMINNVLVGEPMQGDFFTITDPNDVNHKKAYKVVGVETNTHYKTGTTQPSTTQRKLRVAPPITRNVSAGATVNFINPKFRVIQSSDTLEHELDTDNLYSFSLSLEEILP